MFSKALFKQSCKANGVMWSIITFFVCFTLACVMLISGGGSIGGVKMTIQDTIIEGEIDASLQKRAINYYSLAKDGLYKFDGYYKSNFQTIYASESAQATSDVTNYDSLFTAWLGSGMTGEMPEATTNSQKMYLSNFNTWKSAEPNEDSFENNESYNQAKSAWESQRPTGATGIQNAVSKYLATAAYQQSISDLQNYVLTVTKKTYPNATTNSTEYKEILGDVMFAINPNGMFDSDYTSHGEKVPADYDVASIISHISDDTYLTSEERINYIQDRCENSSCIFISVNMTKAENIDLLLDALSSYGVTQEKYDSFGYNYDGIKHASKTTIVSYQARFDYEKSLIDERKDTFATAEAYQNALKEMNDKLTDSMSLSLLSSLPTEVADALEEVGKMDLYSLIVGSIFYKMAGLLLPIIFMIMASNNLIAGQVDSGSMAYILSTSTKREQVTFTQAVYLAVSLFVMFVCTTITSVICLAIVTKPEISLDYGQVILLNLGAFITMFAMSGICFCASCWFDRSKRSMGIGGGLSMFFLVATMLGLFGSPVLPSIIRLEALNYFNYVTIISLFDVISIINKTVTFVWKFAILIAIGLIGYVVGSIKFKKKDLPL